MKSKFLGSSGQTESSSLGHAWTNWSCLRKYKYLVKGTNLAFQESVQNGHLTKILASFKYNQVTSVNVQIIWVHSE